MSNQYFLSVVMMARQKMIMVKRRGSEWYLSRLDFGGLSCAAANSYIELHFNAHNS